MQLAARRASLFVGAAEPARVYCTRRLGIIIDIAFNTILAFDAFELAAGGEGAFRLANPRIALDIPVALGALRRPYRHTASQPNLCIHARSLQLVDRGQAAFKRRSGETEVRGRPPCYHWRRSRRFIHLARVLCKIDSQAATRLVRRRSCFQPFQARHSPTAQEYGRADRRHRDGEDSSRADLR